MNRYLAILLFLLALLACVAGIVGYAASTSAFGSLSDARAGQGAGGQYDAMGQVVTDVMGLVASTVALLGGGLLALILGLLGYAIYPQGPARPGPWRRAGDLLASLAGLVLAAIMLVVLIVASIGFLSPGAAGGLALNGRAYLAGLVVCLPLLVLGAACIRRGLRSLRGSAPAGVARTGG